MTSKPMRLGLTTLAVLVLGAAASSAASAAQFTANSYPTTVTGISPLSNLDFRTEAGSLECAAHYEASFSEASETLTVTPKYTGCEAFGFLEVKFAMNGCDWVFHADGEADIECPAGNSIVMTALSCEVKIGTQTGLKSLDLSNNGAHVDLKYTMGGIAYTVTKDGFLCPYNGTGSKTGATMTDNNAWTLKPVSGGTSISVDP